jgi:hypothetical protein
MFVGIFLGIHLYIAGDVAEKFISLFRVREISYKAYKFLYNKILFEYENKKFEVVPFSNVSFRGIIRGLYYSWGTLDFGIPKSHLDVYIKTKANISYNEDPYRVVIRKYTGSFGEFIKPHKYIDEDLKEYGESISDLFFLGFTKRGKETYLLAMLEWNTKAYVLAKILDVMSEIVEKYEKK